MLGSSLTIQLIELDPLGLSAIKKLLHILNLEYLYYNEDI